MFRLDTGPLDGFCPANLAISLLDCYSLGTTSCPFANASSTHDQ